MDRGDPGGCALQVASLNQIPLGVARGMALAAHRNFFHQIFSAGNVASLMRGSLLSDRFGCGLFECAGGNSQPGDSEEHNSTYNSNRLHRFSAPWSSRQKMLAQFYCESAIFRWTLTLSSWIHPNRTKMQPTIAEITATSRA